MYRSLEPGRNEPCLCGSGRKFKKCCRSTYRDGENLPAAVAALDDEHYDEAVLHARAHFTQYLIWHRAHTVPFLASRSVHAQEMLHIDVAAMSGLLDLLMECYRGLGRAKEFSNVITRLEGCIEDARWKQRIVYQRTISALSVDWDEEVGRVLLKEIGSIDEVDDAEILELYVDLFSDELGFSQYQSLINAIIKNTESLAVRLQYQTLRGIQLVLINDEQAGCTEIDSAIAEYKSAKIRDAHRVYGTLQLARACSFLGATREDCALLKEAESLYREAVKSGNYTKSGSSMLLRELGDVLLELQLTDDAKECYLRAQGYDDTQVGRIKVAKASLLEGDSEGARDCLGTVDYKSLGKAERFDHTILEARIAAEVGVSAIIEDAIKRLQELDPQEPYFREVRDKYIIELRIGKGAGPEAVGLARKLVRWARRYLVLQPNVFGLGFNANALLEDIDERCDPEKSRAVRDE